MKRWMMVLMAVVLLLAPACGGGGKETETPVATATESETPVLTKEAPTTESGGGTQQQTPEPTQENDDNAVPTVSPDALKNLDSYRTKTIMRSEFEDGTTEEVSLLQECIREPFATRTVMATIGETEDATGQMEMIQVGTTQWINFGGQWMQTETTDDISTFEDNLITFEDITSGVTGDEYKYLGRETVNDLSTKHYRLDLSSVQAAAMFGTNVTEASSEVWIANESKLPPFMVRMIVTYKGDIETDRPGTATITQDVYDVNKSFTIEPPEEALAGGLPEDVPMYPGGTELTTMSGMVSFKTVDDAATVTAFYEKALSDNGWGKDPEGFVPTWTKEGRTLELYVSDEETGGASVVIMIQAEE